MPWLNIPAVAWRGAAVGVIIVSLIILFSGVFDSWVGAGMWLFGPVASILSLIFIVGFTLLILVLLWLLKRVPLYYQTALAFALLVGNFVMQIETVQAFLWLFAAVVVLPSVLGGALSLLLNRRSLTFRENAFVFAAVIASGILLILIVLWLFGPGTADKSVVNYFNTKKASLDLPNPSIPGPFHIKTLSYGSGKDYYRHNYGEDAMLKTKAVDGSPFVSGWDGWTGWLRTYFWGFDASEMPLNGFVWYPEGEGPFPLILVVHGNHSMNAFSDVGYNYLGNLLASQGFIAVSVDENFLNSSFFDTWSDFDEVAARGWLLLKHLEAWRKWNEMPECPFYQRVDMDNIGLIGHSRGGEAIVTAKAFNSLPYFPDNGNIAFDFNFSLKALAAIAPKDGQYLPSGITTPIENVNYFAMHGSHDGDVRSFEGTKTYSRLVFNDGKYWFKSAVYIVGANHGQFNEVWDRLDARLPDSLLLNLQPLMSNVEQRTIAEVYLLAFMRACLKDERQYIPLFWDARLGDVWLPETLYVTQFEDSRTAFIYSGKKDLDLMRATLPGAMITQEGLTLWRQQKISLKWGDKLDSAMFVGWKDNRGSLTIKLPIPNPLSVDKESILTFSLADAHENPDKGEPFVPLEEPIDFTVELTDIAGEVASVLLSQDAFLFPQIQTQVYKADFLDNVENSEVVFQTFRFPLEDFLQSNPNLDVAALASLRFVFDRTSSGVVIIDRVGFESNKQL